MELTLYQIDAFTDKLFGGNQAGVIILNSWLSEDLMQNIAAENNLAETAFAVKKDSNFYEIRWFTPLTEVELCGHATLASAKVIFDHHNAIGKTLEFFSPHSHTLHVYKDGDIYTLDFPADTVDPCSEPKGLFDAIGKVPIEILKGKTDYLLIYETEEDIKALRPNFNDLLDVDARGIICSAPGNHADVVSRFFGPAVGINEDPATGSAHTTLTPYWSKKLSKDEISAIQLSKRVGVFRCKIKDERVLIKGNAVEYMRAELHLN